MADSLRTFFPRNRKKDAQFLHVAADRHGRFAIYSLILLPCEGQIFIKYSYWNDCKNISIDICGYKENTKIGIYENWKGPLLFIQTNAWWTILHDEKKNPLHVQHKRIFDGWLIFVWRKPTHVYNVISRYYIFEIIIISFWPITKYAHTFCHALQPQMVRISQSKVAQITFQLLGLSVLLQPSRHYQKTSFWQKFELFRQNENGEMKTRILNNDKRF